MAVIVNLDAPTTKPFMRDLRHGADALGLRILSLPKTLSI
jgi:hypothetical protein